MESETILYKDEENGFSLQLPANWKGRYVVENGSFYCKNVREALGYDGRLFTINCPVGELYTKEDAGYSGPNGRLLIQGNGRSYIVRRPTDYQGSTDKALSAEYDEMRDQSDAIYKTIRLIDVKRPEALTKALR